MPVLSRIEIKAQEQGEIKGTKKMLIKHFAHEFPNITPQLLQQLEGLNNLQHLDAIVDQLYEIKILAALQKLLDKPFLSK